MAPIELAKQINGDLYPEVLAAGSLPAAVNKVLVDIGSPLQSSAEIALIPLPLARVEDGSRFSQMYMAAHERLFTFDFWSQGVAYGNGACSDLNEAAQAIHFWIVEQPNIAGMQSRFGFFVPNEKAAAHESGRAVEHQWETLRKRWAAQQDDAMSPLPLIDAASKHPKLRQLFPFTSLYTLRFSRTTGYPFTNDCPYATPLGKGRFRASANYDVEKEGDLIGEGDADEVVAMLVANLPPDCGPAVDGTAEE